MSIEGPQKVRPRWVTLSAVLAIGAAFVAWAIVWQGRDAWPGIFVNIGTGFVLAGLLVFIEPRFTKRLSAAVTKDVAEKVTSQVTEVTEQRLAAHLDELETRFEERIKERTQEREAAVDSMQRPTFASVMNAFEEADQLKAISGASIIVPASKDEASLVCLKFTLLSRANNNDFDPVANRSTEIGIGVLGASGYPENYSIPWQSDEAVEDIGLRVVESLRAEGAWRTNLINWSQALKNLQLALRTAIGHRSGEEAEKWFSTSSMQELLTENWIVTGSGIESCYPDLHYVFKWSDFPSLPHDGERARVRQQLIPADWPEPGSWPPRPPDGITTDRWHAWLYKALDHSNRVSGGIKLIRMLQMDTPTKKRVTPHF